MHTVCTLFISILSMMPGRMPGWMPGWMPGTSTIPNRTVDEVDVKRYAGTWYSLYSIPTRFDSGSRETFGTYRWNEKGGYFDVVTSYKKPGDDHLHAINSKVYQVPGTNNAQMKAQFVWPFKVDYWVIELAPDYSYVVVGHPQRELLFIMSRSKTMDKKLYTSIVERCAAKGYDVAKLTSQQHEKREAQNISRR